MTFSLMNHPMLAAEKWEAFTKTDHQTWTTLFERQTALLQDRAAPEIMEGMAKLNICHEHIPKLSELNCILQKETNFTVLPVKGYIPEDLFFQTLAERKFPTTCFIRKPHQLDYLPEPDIFHDVFGHVPLLVHPVFADFMQLFGKMGLEAIQAGMLKFAATLYWFTVEFGLVQSKKGLRIYGSGITSSKGESIYCLDSENPVRLKFNPLRVMKTQYHIDAFQRTYFVIESFQQLFNTMQSVDWEEVRDACLAGPDIAQGIVLNDQEKL